MRTKYLFQSMYLLVFATALCLSSCMKDNGICERVPEGYGYFSLSLNPNNPSFTRSVTTVEGSDAENYVGKVAVILYDEEEGMVDYQFVYDISNIGESGLKAFAGTGIASTQPTGDNAKTHVITRAEIVAEKEYRVIVIANPTEAMLAATEKGCDYTDVVWKSYKTTVMDLTGAGERFVMSNSDGPIVLTVGNIASSAAGAELNPVAVYLDRAVAKVAAVRAAGFDDKLDQNMGLDGGTKIYENISDISWSVDVVNNYTYWLRKPTNAKNSAAELSSNRQDYYAEDPNMTTAASAVANTFIKQTPAGLIAATLNPLKSKSENDVYGYVTENTMDIGVDAMLYGTQVVVKCRIQPLGMTSSQNYYSYAGTVFTHQQVMGWLHDGSEVPPSILNAINENSEETITAADFKEILEVTGVFEKDAEEGDAYAEFDGGLTYHYQQWNIYRIPVRHFSDLTPDKWGYYGVVRNNLYVVNITDITGPGRGSNERYIASEIVINPWMPREWDQSVGQ